MPAKVVDCGNWELMYYENVSTYESAPGPAVSLSFRTMHNLSAQEHTLIFNVLRAIEYTFRHKFHRQAVVALARSITQTCQQSKMAQVQKQAPAFRDVLMQKIKGE